MDTTFNRHRKRLNKIVKNKDEQYLKYLSDQLSTTYSRKDKYVLERCKYLIDHLAKHIEISKLRILCVGSRNMGEINYFKSIGACDVTGIDLFSENEEILIMDMHDMRFPDNSFDVILSSHSLEHSFNPQRVVSEFLRVVRNCGFIVIEVPVNCHTANPNIDRWDFETLENLKTLFKPYIKKIYLEEHELTTEKKEHTQVDVIRILFSVEKDPMHGKNTKARDNV